jgi:hypothetical protein
MNCRFRGCRNLGSTRILQIVRNAVNVTADTTHNDVKNSEIGADLVQVEVTRIAQDELNKEANKFEVEKMLERGRGVIGRGS